MKCLVHSLVVLGMTFLVSCGNTAGSAEQTVLTESGYVEVHGGRVYYETRGAGVPIVFIHGNAGDRRHWDKQFQALADRFRVIRYDVRGYGQSPAPSDDTAYSDFGDLASLLDHLRITTAHIVGWSMGSGIAIDFALSHPARTKSLVSVGPWIGGYSSAAAKTMLADMAERVRSAFAEGGQPAAVRAWMDMPLFAATIRDPAAGAEFRRIAAGYSFVNRGQRQPLRPSAVDRVKEIRVPTLVVAGEYDLPPCLEIADVLQASIPGSRKLVMPGTGHLLQMEKPEEFNRQLAGFLLSVGG